MLPKNVSEAEVSDLFSEYGTIKDLQILRGSQLTSKGTSFIILDFLLDWLLVSRINLNCNSSQPIQWLFCMSFHNVGCAFLKYETKEQAISALEAINGKHKMEVRDIIKFWWPFI